MDASRQSGSIANDPVPVAVALGGRPGPTVAAAIDTVAGLAWLPEIEGDVLIATAEPDARGMGRAGARAVAEVVAERRGRPRLVVPKRPPRGALSLLRGRDRWVEVDVSAAGGRVERVPVRRGVMEAAALIGVGSIGTPEKTHPLAIGLWSRFVHPKLAIAARLGGDRAPLAADLAIPFRPRLLVLTGAWRSLPVVVATPDLIAAELAGLAIRHGATTDPADRPRPWEDPLIQRATELGLGVLHPSSLDVRLVWTAGTESPDLAALAQLEDMIDSTLEVR